MVTVSGMKNLLAIAILPALALLADDRSKEPVTATQTDRFQVSATGTIRLENSFGEVDIDGWDRPEVEVTVVRSSEHLYNGKRADAQRRLDAVRVTAKQDGNDVVVSTTYPPLNGLRHPLSRRSDVDLTYTIKAPRASKLVIEQKRGGVNVFDIGGDIHARVINGQITLTLPDKAQYAIDAQSTIGDVYSDFEGRTQRRQMVGQEFDRPAAAPATNLYLRVRVGDIVIQKLHGPPAE